MSTDLTTTPTTPAPRPAVAAQFSTAAASRFMDALEAEVGGREALIQALFAAPPSTDLDYVVGLIAHPSNDCRKLAKICATGNVTLGEFLSAAKAGIMGAAVAKAMLIAAQKVPEITQDVVTRAVVHEGDCGGCSGRGFIIMVREQQQHREVCLICEGTGRQTMQPDFEKQKFVLEKFAEIGPKKGPQLVIDQSDRRSITMDTSAVAHGKLLSAVDKLLYGRRDPLPVIDVDPNPPDTPAQDASESRADDSQP